MIMLLTTSLACGTTEEHVASTSQNAWIERVLGVRLDGGAASGEAAGKAGEGPRSRGLLDIPGLEVNNGNFVLNGQPLTGLALLAMLSPKEGRGSTKFKDPAADGRRAWRRAWEAVENDIGALQHQLVSEADPDLQAIGRADILSRMKSYHAALASSLTALGAAKDNQKAVRSKKAMAAVTDCRDFVKKDKLFVMLERNPLGVSIDITGRLDGVLGELEKSLSAAA